MLFNKPNQLNNFVTVYDICCFYTFNFFRQDGGCTFTLRGTENHFELSAVDIQQLTLPDASLTILKLKKKRPSSFLKYLLLKKLTARQMIEVDENNHFVSIHTKTLEFIACKPYFGSNLYKGD